MSATRKPKITEHDVLYMHTLNGEPAFFHDGQLVYAEKRDHWQDDYPFCVLRRSVAEIRADQRKHRAFRQSHRWEIGTLDFVIVSLAKGTIRWPRKYPGSRRVHASRA